MGYVVKLDDFEGPLEVLHQLIAKSKLSIEDVSLTEVTGQYMNYIESMQKMDIEIASEFLVMAASLLYIKSCKLLPETIVLRGEPVNNLENDIKNQLIEYSKIKEAASLLEERAAANSTSFYRIHVNKQIADPMFSGRPEYESEKLSEAIARIVSKVKKAPTKPLIHTINRDTKSFKARLYELKLFFDKCKQIAFSELFPHPCKRFEVVLTFMALLKMTSDGMLEILQTKPFADVVIQRKESGWAKFK